MLHWLEKAKDQKGKTARLGCLVIFAIAAFYALICTPVYIISMTYYPLSDSVFPSIWDFVQGVVNLSFYWSALGFTLYLSAKYSLKDAQGMIAIYASASACRYVLSLLISTWMMREWSGFGYDFVYVIQDLFLDCVLMAVAVLLIYLFCSKAQKKQSAKLNLQFSSITNFSNPVLKCALAISFIPSLMRVLARFRFDLFYGAPQNRADLLWIVFSYCGDVLIGLIGYLALFLLISQLYLIDEEANSREKKALSGDSV